MAAFLVEFKSCKPFYFILRPVKKAEEQNYGYEQSLSFSYLILTIVLSAKQSALSCSECNTMFNSIAFMFILRSR